jgi:hypothetical protein
LFKNLSFEIVKGALSKDICKLLAAEFRMSRDLALFLSSQDPQLKSPDSSNPSFPFGDKMIDKSFSWYSPLCFEALSNTLIKDIVEKVIGETLYPTYSYARIYHNGAELKKHTDRASSEYAVTCCIDVDPNFPKWSFYVEQKDGTVLEIIQEPGDVLIYKGNYVPHWRNIYNGQEHINAFMFYVRAAGPRAELKYDTRPLLGMSPQSRILDSEAQLKKFPLTDIQENIN